VSTPGEVDPESGQDGTAKEVTMTMSDLTAWVCPKPMIVPGGEPLAVAGRSHEMNRRVTGRVTNCSGQVDGSFERRANPGVGSARHTRSRIGSPYNDGGAMSSAAGLARMSHSDRRGGG
jgi:hypothetical protein